MELPQDYITTKEQCFQDLYEAVANGYKFHEMNTREVFEHLTYNTIGYDKVPYKDLTLWIAEWKSKYAN